MVPPGSGIFVLRGELSMLMTAMKRGARWNSSYYQEEQQSGLMKQFIELKSILIRIDDLRVIEPNIFLGPFLDVIRSEETTGPITSLALSSINKFLSYGLIDPTHSALSATVESIADAVTHARFVGTDQASDGVVLLKIVQVLRTLMLSPEGSALSNESVCEIMLSCFRICFEPRLNELLRRTAEQALKDMVLLLFMRLPQFTDEQYNNPKIRKLKMISGLNEHHLQHNNPKKKHKSVTNTTIISNVPKINTISDNKDGLLDDQLTSTTLLSPTTPNPNLQTLKLPILSTTPATPAGNIVDMQGTIMQTPTIVNTTENCNDDGNLQLNNTDEEQLVDNQNIDGNINENNEHQNETNEIQVIDPKNEDFINSMGVRFIPQNENDSTSIPLVPYGLPCIREILRFLITLCNPLDKQNTDAMIHIGLSLLTVIMEIGADCIGKHEPLLNLVKDEMCKNLFSLLSIERLSIFAADLQLCFLLFESLRSHLKFQLEFYLIKLSEIIASEQTRNSSFEMKELSLDNLQQLFSLPWFAAELYLNYDCNLYSTNLFEDLIKLMSKNSLSATHMIHTLHQLSLDVLLNVLESIEKNCVATKRGAIIPTGRHSRNNSNTENIVIESDVRLENIKNFMFHRHEDIQNSNVINGRNENLNSIKPKVTQENILEIKNKKRILTQGTELFNQRPEKGIEFLQENNMLSSKLDPMEVAIFLRENSGLDKKMIGEYISKKKNVESKILENFVKSFDFSNIQIDVALRQYLETFRLPGEAPLIFLVMEHFAEHWHKCNNEPFANTDAAFRLAYAIIMLNMDQHNYNAKRLNIPMTAEDFLKNLRGLNGNSDFDQEMLTNVYTAIKNEEIIMPAEQTGIVRENYLWKVLLRRGVTKESIFNHIYCNLYDREIFQLIWGPTLAAISFMFDKCTDLTYQKSIFGFTKAALIASHYCLNEELDALILTLCKFSTLLNSSITDTQQNEIALSVSFGLNVKAQLAIKTVFGMIHIHGNCIRESWRNILEIIVQLFKIKLLPKTLIEVEDFCTSNGKFQLILEKPLQKIEAGLFSSLYSYLSSESQRQPTYDEQEIIKLSKRCIKECQIDHIIAESPFLEIESLKELLKCFITNLKPPTSYKSIGLPYQEDITVFIMEMFIKIIIQNRDRMLSLWNDCRDQMYLLITGSVSCGYNYLMIRATIGLLKLAIYLMRNADLCPVVLESLKIFLMLKPKIILNISKQISTGLFEILKTSAQNIHTENDWNIIFTLLECVGAGAYPPEFDDIVIPTGTKSDGAASSEEDSGLPDRGYISDSGICTKSDSSANSRIQTAGSSNENWILVNKESEEITLRTVSSMQSLIYPCKLGNHSSFALVKCWDSLAFIVRNAAHITPYNFESCVRCIRTFVEASVDDGSKHNKKINSLTQNYRKKKTRKDIATRKDRKADGDSSSNSEDESESSERYETISIQLLDLIHALYTRTAQIFNYWAEVGGVMPQSSTLWTLGWCPLLQSIARLATDKRKQVRGCAVTCLQRSFILHDLQALSGPEWSSCFKQVLFPLLCNLLEETPNTVELLVLEDSRIRTSTLMSKVFLHHLTPLLSLSTFNLLWLEILDYIEKFMKIGTEMLHEAVLESLKNMLLVMHSVHIFHYNDGLTHTPLWNLTWKRIEEFLPSLKDELFVEDRNVLNKSDGLPMTPPTVDKEITSVTSVQNQLAPTQTNITKSSIIFQPLSDFQNMQSSSIFIKEATTIPTIYPVHIQQQVPITVTTISHVQHVMTPNLLIGNEKHNDVQITNSVTIPSDTLSNEFNQSTVQSMNCIHPSFDCHFDYSNLIQQNQAISDINSINSSPTKTGGHFELMQKPLICGMSIPPSQLPVTSSSLLSQPTLSIPSYTDVKETVNTKESNNINICVNNTITTSNVFQSANYFGNTNSDIPPGSEMLFGEP